MYLDSEFKNTWNRFVCFFFISINSLRSDDIFFCKIARVILRPNTLFMEQRKYVVCSMQHVACSMQYVVCSMQYVVCSMQYVVYSMQYVVCRGAAELLSNSLQVLKIGKELENKINWKLLFLLVSKIISTLLFCTS